MAEAGGLGEDQDPVRVGGCRARDGRAQEGRPRASAAAQARRRMRVAHRLLTCARLRGEGEVVQVEQAALAVALKTKNSAVARRGVGHVGRDVLEGLPAAGHRRRCAMPSSVPVGEPARTSRVPPAPPEETRAVMLGGVGQDVRREGDPVAVVDVADGLAAVAPWPCRTTWMPDWSRRSARPGGGGAGGRLVVAGQRGLAAAPPSVYSASKTPKMLASLSCSPSAGTV